MNRAARAAVLGSIGAVRWKRARRQEPPAGEPVRRCRVLVYSSNRTTRAAVVGAVGPRPSPELPEVEFHETATAAAVLQRMDAGGVDLAVLDGEASPAGGLGLARQLRDEVDECPPILVLLGRRADAWLAEWSRADAAVVQPLDPFEVARVVTRLLRSMVGTSAAG